MAGDKRVIKLADMGIKLAATKQKFNEVMSEMIKDITEDIDDYQLARCDGVIASTDALVSAKHRLWAMKDAVGMMNDYYNDKTHTIHRMLQKLDEENNPPKNVVAKYVGVLYGGACVFCHTKRLGTYKEAFEEISEKLLQYNAKGTDNLYVKVNKVYVVE